MEYVNNYYFQETLKKGAGQRQDEWIPFCEFSALETVKANIWVSGWGATHGYEVVLASTYAAKDATYTPNQVQVYIRDDPGYNKYTKDNLKFMTRATANGRLRASRGCGSFHFGASKTRVRSKTRNPVRSELPKGQESPALLRETPGIA